VEGRGREGREGREKRRKRRGEGNIEQQLTKKKKKKYKNQPIGIEYQSYNL
jgi:hypothetical protein